MADVEDRLRCSPVLPSAPARGVESCRGRTRRSLLSVPLLVRSVDNDQRSKLILALIDVLYPVQRSSVSRHGEVRVKRL